MQSIRFRLAVSYSIALTATMVAFGGGGVLGTHLYGPTRGGSPNSTRDLAKPS